MSRGKRFRRIFIRYGSVKDVFIPKKVDRKGNRYGFVRYKDVEDAKQLEKKLDSIVIGDRKLTVNLAKFSRFEESNTTSRSYQSVPTQGRQYQRGDTESQPAINYWKERIKVARTTQSEYRPLGEGKKGQRELTQWEKEGNFGEKWRGPEYKTTGEDRKWAGGCYVGEIHNPSNLFMLQEMIYREGYYSLKVTPMGGKSSAT